MYLYIYICIYTYTYTSVLLAISIANEVLRASSAVVTGSTSGRSHGSPCAFCSTSGRPLEVHLECTRSSLGRHLDPIWRSLGAQKAPKGAHLEPKERPRRSKDVQQARQDSPKGAKVRSCGPKGRTWRAPRGLWRPLGGHLRAAWSTFGAYLE